MDEDISLCHKHGAIVYPVKDGDKWFVEVKIKRAEPHRYSKSISNSSRLNGAELEQPIRLTYQHLAKQIRDGKTPTP